MCLTKPASRSRGSIRFLYPKMSHQKTNNKSNYCCQHTNPYQLFVYVYHSHIISVCTTWRKLTTMYSTELYGSVLEFVIAVLYSTKFIHGHGTGLAELHNKVRLLNQILSSLSHSVACLKTIIRSERCFLISSILSALSCPVNSSNLCIRSWMPGNTDPAGNNH